MTDATPDALPALPEVHNPWRESLENCASGDNYLRASEYLHLIEELDDLYRYRSGQHDSLNVAYANGRDDQREEDAEAIATLQAEVERLREAAQVGIEALESHASKYCEDSMPQETVDALAMLRAALARGEG